MSVTRDRLARAILVVTSALLAAPGLTSCTNNMLKAVPNIAPSAAPQAIPMTGPAPLAVAFASHGTDPNGTVASFSWSFGDGGTATVSDPSHTYNAAGTYKATVVVTDNDGAIGTAMVTVTVTAGANRPPTVTAAVNPTSGLAPLAVSFTATASDPDGTIASYAWTFGDGGTSAQQNPSHTYASAGTFNAAVTVTDNGGATATANVTVAVATASNQPPHATVSASPTSGTAPLAVTFTGSGTDPDGTIASYAWTFGDGATSTLQSPSHTYQGAGNFSATLKVTDNLGATGSASVSISVNAPGNMPPTATASANPTSGTAPLAVTFTGSGTDPDGTIASYAWTFGDGATSTLQSPSHTYAAAGNYSATLTVTDNAGATGSAVVGISVLSGNNAPVANAGPDQVYVDPGATVSLNGTGSIDPDGNMLTYQWVQTAGPAVTLNGAGTATPSFVAVANTTVVYTFQLTVTDNGSPPMSGSDTVNVSARVTYINLIQSLYADRGTQSGGKRLGCVYCHRPGGSYSSAPLDTYQGAYQWRSQTKSKLAVGGSMRQYLLTGEPDMVINWINNGAPEKN